MDKHSLINLVKELIALEDLSTRGEDLLFIKREYRYLLNKEEESFYESSLTNEFMSLYDELAKKAPKLNQTSLDEKKEIIELTKKLLERKDIVKAGKDLEAYSEAFRKAGKCTQEQDDALWAEFKALNDKYYENRRAHFEAIDKSNAEKKAQKEAIIEQAKELLVIKNIKESNEKMDALMNSWKEVGFSGKDNDEELWQKFSEVRKEFNLKKKEHYEEMQKIFEERAAKKEEMIKVAKKILADSDFSKEEVQKIKDLRSEFNAIGFTGKDKDDDLYERFNEVIKKYFDDMKFYTF